MPKKAKKNYVNNKQLYQELVKFIPKKIKNSKEPIPKYIYQSIDKIINNYSHNKKFSSYTYLDIMKSEAMYTCINYIAKFNPERSENPFAYYTAIAHNAFIKIINQETKVSKVKQYYLDEEIQKHSDKVSKMDYSNINKELDKKSDKHKFYKTERKEELSEDAVRKLLMGKINNFTPIKIWYKEKEKDFFILNTFNEYVDYILNKYVHLDIWDFEAMF